MAKTLQEILDPKFIPDIVSRINEQRLPLILEPEAIMVSPTYDIPRHLTDQEMLQRVVTQSWARAQGHTLFHVWNRGNGKFYIKAWSTEE